MSIPAVSGSSTGTWKSIINTIIGLINPAFTARPYKVADAAALAALAGTYTLVEGDRADQADTNQIYRYDGSAWVDMTPAVIPVRPSVNSSTGTSTSVGTDGTLTLTAITAVVVTYATSRFEDYDIEISGTKAVAGTTTFRFAASGTIDASGANHDFYGSSWTQAGVIAAATSLNQATIPLSNGVACVAEEYTIELRHPNVVKQTRGFLMGQLVATIGTGETRLGVNLGHRQTTQWNGFQLVFAQAFTGTVKFKGRI